MSSKKIYRFNLMTLDPKKIMKKRVPITNKETRHREWGFYLDFGKGLMKYDGVLMSTDRYAENALFRQILFSLGENDPYEWTESLLKDHLFYLDFSKLFLYRRELKQEYDLKAFVRRVSAGLTDDELKELGLNETLYFLFKNGFWIHFEGEESERHFVPFEGSASMLRESRLSFINEDILEKINERLLMGMDFSFGSSDKNDHIKVQPHKYFAYRGLYMTEGTRVASKGEKDSDSIIELNENTVIVIEDAHIKSKPFWARYAKESSKEKNYWDFHYGEKGDYRINSFDGEGFICPEYAKEINKQVLGVNKETGSFQIRMPFIKGMLHCVDYRSFFYNECEEDISQGYYIKDLYGIRRDLGKAKIILTESMLKNHKWLKEFVKKSLSKDADPMKYLFDQMKVYDHSLFIVRTDANLHNEDGKIKLNYQFLNTLDMDKNIFKKKIQDYIDFIRDIETKPDDQREFALGRTETTKCTWKYALSRNRALLSDKYIKSKINEMIDARIKEIDRGNIRVDGVNRFLSGDLLALLIHIMKQSESPCEGKIDELKKLCLNTEDFVIPSPGLKLQNGKKYGLLRNPHLSRNEDCVLYYKEKDIYDKYFKELSGIIMVAYASLAPMTLGGADFDGDMVKLITDTDVVKAMIEGKKSCKSIAVIPSEKESPVPVPGRIEFGHVREQFGNQIGSVSNYAIRLGEKVYSTGSYDESIMTDELSGKNHKYVPADCTILTGLEIDAAKTGRHPRENIDELKEQVGTSSTDYIEILNEMKYLRKENISVKECEKKTDKTGRSFYYIAGKNGSNGIEIPLYNEESPNIEMLHPMYFNTMYSERPVLKEEPEKKHVFKDAVSDGADKDITARIDAIVDVYNLFIRRFWMLRKGEEIRNDQNWYGKALNIIKRQYYGRSDLAEIELAIEEAFFVLDDLILNNEKYMEYGNSVAERCRAIADKIRDKKWIFASKDDRDCVLKEILMLDEADLLFDSSNWRSILANFSNGGHMLLYYLIKAVEQDNVDSFALEEYYLAGLAGTDNARYKLRLREGGETAYNDTYKDVFEKMKSVHFECVWDNCPWVMYKEKAIDIIRQKIDELFGEANSETVARCAKMLHKRHNAFFWELYEGEKGIKDFKKADILIDYLPYQHWEKSEILPDVEKVEEEEEFYDVERIEGI